MSPSSRRAWIEILPSCPMLPCISVALLAEGVDRNSKAVCGCAGLDVALLAEGVDRNCQFADWRSMNFWSPSSRRAWIEIEVQREAIRALLVALLAEGVDRNCWPSSASGGSMMVALLAEGVDRNLWFQQLHKPGDRSPSSRRAWIEILLDFDHSGQLVSPSSRRAWIEICYRPSPDSCPRRRPPRGGRG